MDTTLNEFSRLYADYQERFIRFANSYVHDRPVAEDIAVDAYRWRKGLICFKNESFASIMADFEKYYGLEIIIQSEKVKKQYYSGKFRQVDGVDYALRVPQKDISFKYTRDDEHDKIIIK